MAADAIFIDTNVLVFATIPSSPFHQPAIVALHALAQSGAETWISHSPVTYALRACSEGPFAWESDEWRFQYTLPKRRLGHCA